MNTEDSEFKRIEAEAKRRAIAKEYDDTQTYTNESAEAYAYRCGYAAGAVDERKAQRTWVGLTNDEIKALASWWPSYDQMPALMVLAKEIQENLKERNNG